MPLFLCIFNYLFIPPIFDMCAVGRPSQQGVGRMSSTPVTGAVIRTPVAPLAARSTPPTAVEKQQKVG